LYFNFQPNSFGGVILILGIFLGAVVVFAAMPKGEDNTATLIKLQNDLGLGMLPSPLFVGVTLLWTTLAGLLLFGLLTQIWEVISSINPTSKETILNWRLALVKLTALTATFGAVIAFPFTIVRLALTREQTDTATEELFNDKIDAAVSDLHAQRQITKWDEKVAQNGWEDDVTRRNGAIDRLLGLASEEPKAAPRIARMLSVYVKELSREYPAKTPPQTDDPKLLKAWAQKLKFARSDMQNAVQVLGQLRKESGHTLDNGEIDLTGTNLQGFDLRILDFNNVSFRNAQLQGADLFSAQFDPATTLSSARFSCAALRLVDFSETTITQDQLDSAFGDATVTLPGGKGTNDAEWPDHWSKEELGIIEFDIQWRAFQADNGFDPNNPD
jgi:hypothetical protein